MSHLPSATSAPGRRRAGAEDGSRTCVRRGAAVGVRKRGEVKQRMRTGQARPARPIANYTVGGRFCGMNSREAIRADRGNAGHAYLASGFRKQGSFYGLVSTGTGRFAAPGNPSPAPATSANLE